MNFQWDDDDKPLVRQIVEQRLCTRAVENKLRRMENTQNMK